MTHLNLILSRINQAVHEYGATKDVAWTFNEWIHDTSLGNYFGASTQADGSLHATLTPEAMQLDLDGTSAVLAEAGIELVSFALFAASPCLPREPRDALSTWVNNRILEFRNNSGSVTTFPPTEGRLAVAVLCGESAELLGV